MGRAGTVSIPRLDALPNNVKLLLIGHNSPPHLPGRIIITATSGLAEVEVRALKRERLALHTGKSVSLPTQ
jgi:hypothetical protein